MLLKLDIKYKIMISIVYKILIMTAFLLLYENTSLLSQDKNTPKEEADSAGKNKNTWMQRMYDNITKEKFKQGSDSADNSNKDGLNLFQEVKIAKLSENIGKKIKMDGFPVVVKKDYFLMLVEKKLIQVNCQSVTREIDAMKSKEMLNRIIEKGDKEIIIVYGIVISQHMIEGRFININNSLYEMYWVQ